MWAKVLAFLVVASSVTAGAVTYGLPTNLTPEPEDRSMFNETYDSDYYEPSGSKPACSMTRPVQSKVDAVALAAFTGCAPVSSELVNATFNCCAE